MADNLRKRVEQRKTGLSSESDVRELFNIAASKALNKYLQRISTGEIAIDNMADFVRILGAYKEINGIAEAMDGKTGQSMLPEINMKQDKVIEEQITEGKLVTDEEGQVDVSGMSVEDVADLLRDLDIAQNTTNEGSF